MSELQEEKVLIKTIVCPAKISDFNPKLGASTLDHKGSIASAKAAVTKLSKNFSGYAPFYIVENYFKDPITKKPIAPVLVMGKEKKVQKHFVTVEMKSGKIDQRSSANQKEAATGRVYAEQRPDGIVLCFEPHPKCKVPAPKWPKIFKALKPCLKGLSCVVVPPSPAALAEAAAEEAAAGGATVTTAATDGATVTTAATDGATITTATTDGATTTTTTTTDAGTTTTTTTEDGATTTTAQPAFNAAEIKALITSISNGLKSLPTTVVPKIKNGTATEADRTMVSDLLGQLDSFAAMYETAPANVKTQLQKTHGVLVGQKPKLETIISKIDQTLTAQPGGSTGGTTEAELADISAIDPDLAALLAEAEALAKEAEQTKQVVEQDLAANSEPLPSGQAMLDNLYA